MGALADYAALKASIESGKPYFFNKSATVSGQATKLHGTWGVNPGAGATPSTAAACDANTVGALLTDPKITSLTNSYYASMVEMAGANRANQSFILIDRLSHQGGLSGTATGAQTTNLPTAALTRYTSGVGVMAALEVYSAVGASATTASVSYTNQDGTSGRTSKDVAFGGADDGNTGQRRFIILPLQDGDTGVRSVESVTLAASTGTAGNFGVTLVKPILLLPNVMACIHAAQQRCINSFFGGHGSCERVLDTACLTMLFVQDVSSSPIFMGAIYLAEA